ncbi:MAG: HAD hydrolase-like protein [Rickettsiales bacterium]|nr:HAD hydrolase-like protein [Rickettsiales bacterium]
MTRALPTPEAIIFDWDNTLVNTWPIIHAALEATFIEMGLTPWSFDETRNRVRKSMRDSFPEIFGADWEKAGVIYQTHYRKQHLVNLEPLPKAQALLEHIKARKLHCVVVSNKKGPNLRQEIAHLGWEGYFETAVGADDAARDKPFCEPVLMAFDKSHIKPGPHVWFIGDSDIDLECAFNTGCTAILYGESAREHPQYTATHFLGHAYHLHVHHHDEIIALLG